MARQYLCSELTETAFATIHDPNSPHGPWVKAVDEFNAKRWSTAA